MKAAQLSHYLFYGCVLLSLASCSETVERGSFDAAVRETGTIDTIGPADSLISPDSPPIDPNQDTDGDQLPDAFEALYSPSLLDPSKPDTDGDGTADGAEDEDGDGWTALEEWNAWKLDAKQSQRPSPVHKDLFVELDYQQDRGPTDGVLAKAIEAFSAVDLPNPDQTPGIFLHFVIDERDLPKADMEEDLNARTNYLAAHGPQTAGPGSAMAKMVHVMIVAARPGNASRGGDTVALADASAEKAGVLIYHDNLNQIFPVCGSPTASKISFEEGLTSTLVHELGHTLQLGHDTDIGGGTNPYNVMSTDLGECDLLQKRTRGTGNLDPSLGATESKGGPRFSKAAASLMKLKNKISVEANQFEVQNGYEM